jgi:phosphoribosylformimino-5-aminoimidazole carboxamide ribotide isomerase
MILLPAVDIRQGRAVRLRQGDFGRETVYSDDPLEAARSFVAAGARQLHVVDLDGAREGEPANLDHLARITRELGVPALAAGARRVVVGTAAYTDPDFLREALETWNPRLLVAVDVRGDHVSVSGWTRATQMLPEEVIRRMQRVGVRHFAYTNVDRDGTLDGPDLDEVRRIGGAIRGRFLYSGGIGSLEDLRGLRSLRLVNLAGVIAGKALYERRFTIAEAHRVLEERH